MPSESQIRIDHPDWVPVDKYGVNIQGGPLSFAYPGARKAMIDLMVKHTNDVGYDGVFLLTYNEVFSLRYQDEYGFNDPIVNEFHKRYGVDIRTEAFDKGDWADLRGEYLTKFMEELRTELNAKNIKLGISINPDEPNRMGRWPYTGTIMVTGGTMTLDYSNYIDSNLVDMLCVRGNSASTVSTAQYLQGITDSNFIEISFMTSSPYSFGDDIRKMGSLGDDKGYLSGSTLGTLPLSSLNSLNPYKRLKVLQQIIDGETSATLADVNSLASDSNLLVRRLALRAIADIGDVNGMPTIVNGLSDSVQSVRNAAMYAMYYLQDANTPDNVLDAVDAAGNFMLNDRAVPAIQKCGIPSYAQVRQDVGDTMTDMGEPNMVRIVCARAFTEIIASDVIQDANLALYDPNPDVQYYAAWALGHSRIKDYNEAVEALLNVADGSDSGLSYSVMMSLKTQLLSGGTAGQAYATEIIDVLESKYASFDSDCVGDDCLWGYMSVGEAILALGQDGKDIM